MSLYWLKINVALDQVEPPGLESRTQAETQGTASMKPKGTSNIEKFMKQMEDATVTLTKEVTAQRADLGEKRKGNPSRQQVQH